MPEFVEFELKNNIAIIKLNRPEKKNALTLEMLQNLTRIGDNLKTLDNHILRISKPYTHIAVATTDNTIQIKLTGP